MTVTNDFVTLDSCDDISTWTATGQAAAHTLDTDNKMQGTASLNLGKTGIAAVDFDYDRDFSPAINIQNLLLVFWVYVKPDILDLIGIAYVYAYDSLGNWHRWNIKDSLKKGWAPVVMGGRYGDSWSATFGDMTDVVRIRLYFETQAATDTIAVGDIKMDYWHLGRRFTVTGGTEASELDVFEEVYQHDQANVLGITEKFRAAWSTRQGFVIRNAEIYIDADSWCKAENLSIIELLPHGRYSYYYTGYCFIKKHDTAHMRFGRVLDASRHETAYGCLLYIDVYHSGAIGNGTDLLSSEVFFTNYGAVGGSKIWNCIFYGVCIAVATDNDVFNLTINNAWYSGVGAINYKTTGVYEKLFMIHNYNAFYLYRGYPISCKNVIARGNLYLVRLYEPTVDSHFINFDVDNWTFNCIGDPAVYTGRVYREYEFNLTVRDKKTKEAISGATITLWDKDENQVFQVTTDADGKTATQTVKHGYFDLEHGNTEQLYGPFHLRVEKTGYQTYDDYGIVLDHKTELEMGLNKAVGVFLDFGRPVINLKKTDPENKNVLVL